MHLLKFEDYLLQMVCKSLKESDFCNPDDWAKYFKKNNSLLFKVKLIMSEIIESANISEFTPFPFSTKNELVHLAKFHSSSYQSLSSFESIEINKLLNMRACICDKDKVKKHHSKLSIINL